MNPRDNSSSAATTPPNGATPKAIAVSAIADIAKGYAVLPWQYVTEAGKRIKRPLLAGWQTNPITAASDWRWNGSGHGIVLREDDRILVVDVDVKNGAPGIATVRRWRDEAGVEIGRYAVQRTPSGGIHYIGRIPGGFPADSLPIRRTGRPDGVDLLRAKSWIGRSTGYTPTRDLPPLTELPEWPVEFLEYLADLCGAAASQTPPPQDELRAPSIDRLTEVVNATPNSGPDFEAREAYLRVGYAIKAAAGPENDAEGLELFQAWAARWDGGTNDPDTVAADWRGMNGPYRVGFPYLCALADMPAVDPADEFTADPEAKPSELAPKRFRELTVNAIKNLPAPEWLVDEILLEKTVAVLYGAPGLGKSFLALDIALAIGSGRPCVLGADVKPGPVVYVAPEGSAGMGRRVVAWERANKVETEANVRFVPETLNLLNDRDVSAFIEQYQPLNPRLVVIDTLARSIPGGDENSATDMGRAIASCERIQRAIGATVMLVHHVNAGGERERGSSALRGAVDTMIKMDGAQGGHITVSCDKQKDAEQFRRRRLQLRRIEWQDANGRPVSAAVLTSEINLDTLSGAPLAALMALATFEDEGGASYTRWSEVCGLGKGRAFNDARSLLLAGGYVALSGRTYGLTDKGREALEVDGATGL